MTLHSPKSPRFSQPVRHMGCMVLLLVAMACVVVAGRLYYDSYTGGALLRATIVNDTYQAEALLQQGADPNRSSWLERNRTALMFAVAHDNLLLIKALIAHGANVNARDDHGKSVLQWANPRNGGGNAQVIQLLQQAGAKE